MRRVVVVAVACLVLGLLLYVAFNVAMPTYVVTAASMEPLLRPGEKIMVRPKRRNWKHADLVMYRLSRGSLHIGRVIGIPGDRLHLDRRELIRNGAKVVEPYVQHILPGEDEYRDSFPRGESIIPFDTPQYRTLKESIRDGEIVVPPGCYFVMGDNRENSADSRYHGYVFTEDVLGTPIAVTWSRKPAGVVDWERSFRGL